MSLYNFTALLEIAKARQFKAVGRLILSGNAAGFFKAAKQTNSPLMIQISTGTAQYLGYRLLVDAVRSLSAVKMCLPVCTWITVRILTRFKRRLMPDSVQ
jgi:fructose-bisphosphate aldolase class II